MSIDEKNKVEPRTLYLVGTPIGNLADLSERALKVLRECDFIAAEDTRNTSKLLTCFGIKKELVSYHEHNRRARGEELCDRIENGESCALVTDAGMPAISDPGEDLVRLCATRGIAVSVIPGPSACISALALSALSTARFCFEGFIPVPNAERKRRLEEIKRERRTLIFYEAPHKLRTTLTDLLSTFGDRRISLCREITKKNEEVIRTTIAGAVRYYQSNEPRGEYVLVVEGDEEFTGVAYSAPINEELLTLTPEAHVAHYESTGFARMDAIKKAAKDRGMTKSELYNLLKND